MVRLRVITLGKTSMRGSVSLRYKRAARILMAVLILSLIGTLFEASFAFLSSSIILYTDVLHWLIDTLLEVFTVLSLYLASRVYKRFSWLLLYLESLMALVIISFVVVLYFYVFFDYVSSVSSSSSTYAVSTTNPYLALVTLFGGFITLIALLKQYRAYKELRLEILKVEYKHALLDTFSSFIATAGVVGTAFTRSLAIELTTIVLIAVFIVHSLASLAQDAVKTISGSGVDPEIKYRIIEKLNRFEEFEVSKVDVRKVGSFYVVSITVSLDPNTTLLKIHKLRKKIIGACREVSELIYHVDVVFLPRRTWVRSRSVRPNIR